MKSRDKITTVAVRRMTKIPNSSIDRTNCLASVEAFVVGDGKGSGRRYRKATRPTSAFHFTSRFQYYGLHVWLWHVHFRGRRRLAWGSNSSTADRRAGDRVRIARDRHRVVGRIVIAITLPGDVLAAHADQGDGKRRRHDDSTPHGYCIRGVKRWPLAYWLHRTVSTAVRFHQSSRHGTTHDVASIGGTGRAA